MTTHSDIPEPMRHMYRGLFFGLVYAQAQSIPERILEVDLCMDDFDMTYSPSRSIQHAEHFYSEPPPLPDDAVTYRFEPRDFLEIAADCDSEAAIIYLNITPCKERFGGDYCKVTLTNTEGDCPPPDDMEWRNFADHDNDPDPEANMCTDPNWMSP